MLCRQLFISQRRIKKYLQQPEMIVVPGERREEPGLDGRGAVAISHATYSYAMDDDGVPPVLRDVTMEAKGGSAWTMCRRSRR